MFSKSIGRRDFVKWSGAIAGVSLLPFQSILMGEVPAAEAFDLSEFSLTEADQEVIAFIQSYGGTFYFSGGHLLGRLQRTGYHHVSLLLEVKSFDQLKVALGKAQNGMFEKCLVQGNLLTFSRGDTSYTVDNLPFADFWKYLYQLDAPGTFSFAHQALLYQPLTREVQDPFQALEARDGKPVLKWLDKRRLGVKVFEDVLNGLVDQGRFGMVAGDEFTRIRDGVLDLPVLSREKAQKLSMAFLQRLPALAGAHSVEWVKDLLKTKCISGALSTVYGVSPEGLGDTFDVLRAGAKADVSNGAVWLAVLLGDSIRKGVAPDLFSDFRGYDYRLASGDFKAATDLVKVKS